MKYSLESDIWQGDNSKDPLAKINIKDPLIKGENNMGYLLFEMSGVNLVICIKTKS